MNISNQCYLKNGDVWESLYDVYGGMLWRGTYEAFLTPSANKTPITNAPRNINGEKVLTKSIGYKEKRDITFSVFIEGRSQSEYLSRYKKFVDKISQGVTEWKIPALNTNENEAIFKLVYKSCSKYGNYGLTRGKFTLIMTEYDPR